MLWSFWYHINELRSCGWKPYRRQTSKTSDKRPTMVLLAPGKPHARSWKLTTFYLCCLMSCVCTGHTQEILLITQKIDRYVHDLTRSVICFPSPRQQSYSWTRDLVCRHRKSKVFAQIVGEVPQKTTITNRVYVLSNAPGLEALWSRAKKKRRLAPGTYRTTRLIGGHKFWRSGKRWERCMPRAAKFQRAGLLLATCEKGR